MRYLVKSGDDRFPRGYTLGLFPPTTMREDGAVLITSNPALMVTRMPIITRPMYLPDDDIKRMATSVLGHRLILKPESRLRKISPTAVIHEILSDVSVPVLKGKGAPMEDSFK